MEQKLYWKDFNPEPIHYIDNEGDPAIEKWLPVVGYGDAAYEVSDLGRVKSLGRKIVTYKGWSFTLPTKILSQGTNQAGYPFVWLYGLPKKRCVMTHQLVAKAFVENPENKLTVNHIGGLKIDNRACNLEWLTHAENNAHARKTGLNKTPSGEQNAKSKLTRHQVNCIRRLHRINPSFSRKSVGLKLGVAGPYIHQILTYKTWKD